MDNNQYYNQYGGGYPQGYGQQYPGQQQPQQQAQQYQASAPQIRNPFAPPPPAAYAAHNASFDPGKSTPQMVHTQTSCANFRTDFEQQVAQWQSAYAPADQQKKTGKNTGNENANLAPLGQRGGIAGGAEGVDGKTYDDGKYTVVRKGGGESWEDKSLLEWDPQQFRIMVGNLAGEVTDDSLAKAFAQYGVAKARVIRDKRTTKSKGFGFVAFTDAEQGFKAAREMTGKYIGSHPVTIQRAKTDVKPVVRKDNNKYKGKNNKQNKNRGGKNDKDPLKANTQAGIDKKPAKPATGLKLLG